MSEGITDIEKSQIQTNYDKVVYKFDDMELDENLLRGVFGYGFEEPSAIQQRAIMPIIEGVTMSWLRLNLVLVRPVPSPLLLCKELTPLSRLLSFDVGFN